MGNKRLEIRSDILKKVTSEEGAQITPYLSMIYMRLTQAPTEYWERENVMRFTERAEDEQTVTTAWAQLTALVRVSPDVVRKALEWLNDQGVVIYSTSRNEREIILTFEGLRQTDIS